MDISRILPDGPGVHRVCGRECSDGSPCQNTVDTPGASCHLHPADAPRVDDGPEDASEVPLSGRGGDAARAAAVIGKALAVVAVTALGLSPFLSDLLIHAAAILTALTLALALDAYQRRAVSE